MRYALIADTFPPLRTSGAVQLRDLSREFVRQGHELTIMLPSSSQAEPWQIDDFDGVRVVRLRAPKTKDINYIRRTIGEFLMPFMMRHNLKKSPLANERWDGIIWYAPSIFHGPLAKTLKKDSGCKGYLIIRDIFPEWAVDMGLMGRGLSYRFFDAIARYQYSVADVIGVQTSGNLAYFDRWLALGGGEPSGKVERNHERMPSRAYVNQHDRTPSQKQESKHDRKLIQKQVREPVSKLIQEQNNRCVKNFTHTQESKPSRKLEVLQNWLGQAAQSDCSIRISETVLTGRKIFVYAGNMGVAQGMGILLDLADQLSARADVGFLFVGRGSDAVRLKASAQNRGLNNVLFFDEIHPDEIPDLYAQCHVGIVALDPRHKSHNIPGKFLTYMQSGLPVLANVNAGNDLCDLIRDERVGQVCESNQVEDLVELAEAVLGQVEEDLEMAGRCRSLFAREFAVEQAVRQIVAGLG
jgi:glycosyltransferase involved in cell wall biosynthesis